MPLTLSADPAATGVRNALLLEGVHAAAATAFEDAGFVVHRVPGALEDHALADAIAEHDACVVGIRSKSRARASFFSHEHVSRLTAIGCFCIGTNQVDLRAARAAGVPVFNSPFSNTRSVAEMTIAQIIALSRGLFDRSRELHEGRWRKSAGHPREVRGRTLGIIGYGHIGAQVSVLAEAMGMRVLYHDVRACLPLGNAEARDSLTDVLAASDFVTVHVPSTSRTDGLIDRTAIEAMKPGTILINNARGSVVDLVALASSLESGHIGGAAIDVFPEEPAASDTSFTAPLAGLPNVILTPHIGGSTAEAQAAIGADVASKLIDCQTSGSTTEAVNVPQVELPRVRTGQYRILHWHNNVPGVLSALHGRLADRGVNINAEFLQSDSDLSYVIIDVDAREMDAVRCDLATIPETIRVRTLSPDRAP